MPAAEMEGWVGWDGGGEVRRDGSGRVMEGEASAGRGVIEGYL